MLRMTRGVPTLLVAAVVLAGCGSSRELTRIPADRLDEVDARVPGKSRVRLRTGTAMTAYDVSLHDGTATWRSVRPDLDWTRPLRDVDSVQLKNTGKGVVRGFGLGLAVGFFLGVSLEVANGTQNDWLFSESDRRTLAGIALGAVGAVVGGVTGGATGAWEDRYRFLPPEGESP